MSIRESVFGFFSGAIDGIDQLAGSNIAQLYTEHQDRRNDLRVSENSEGSGSGEQHAFTSPPLGNYTVEAGTQQPFELRNIFTTYQNPLLIGGAILIGLLIFKMVR